MSSLNLKGKALLLAILVTVGWMCLRHAMPGKSQGSLILRPEQIDPPKTPIPLMDWRECMGFLGCCAATDPHKDPLQPPPPSREAW